MKLSPKGIALLKRFEGVSLKSYQDSVGVWTIGYGHTSMAGGLKVKRGLTITQHQADQMLIDDLGLYEQAVMKAIKRSPTQNQFDAMTSLCFNIGPRNFSKSSIVRNFNSGDVVKAANSFLLWNKAGGKVLKGLTNRREVERLLFLSASQAEKPAPQSQNPIPAPTMPKPLQSVPTPVSEAPKPVGFWAVLIEFSAKLFGRN